MLKKRLGSEAIERDWILNGKYTVHIYDWFKIPSTLIIPDGCKKIGHRAFYDCRDLREVVIPENVEEIKWYAFYCCYKATIILKKPKSEFKYIGGSAFDECSKVKVSEVL